mmetsp:Transcript_17459/g.33708  ORF Transcript_17459/g.33708 Transcript_17459/m.33708 type:complete len:228 (-) Transcript_17459:769-1452(-)
MEQNVHPVASALQHPSENPIQLDALYVDITPVQATDARNIRMITISIFHVSTFKSDPSFQGKSFSQGQHSLYVEERIFVRDVLQVRPHLHFHVLVRNRAESLDAQVEREPFVLQSGQQADGLVQVQVVERRACAHRVSGVHGQRRHLKELRARRRLVLQKRRVPPEVAPPMRQHPSSHGEHLHARLHRPRPFRARLRGQLRPRGAAGPALHPLRRVTLGQGGFGPTA